MYKNNDLSIWKYDGSLLRSLEVTERETHSCKSCTQTLSQSHQPLYTLSTGLNSENFLIFAVLSVQAIVSSILLLVSLERKTFYLKAINFAKSKKRKPSPKTMSFPFPSPSSSFTCFSQSQSRSRSHTQCRININSFPSFLPFPLLSLLFLLCAENPCQATGFNAGYIRWLF